ncbi:MAG TPA: DUF3566 domain-containing protein, partial [Propionicimonas sp.]
MTDRPGTAGKTTTSGGDAPQWRVDGNSADPTGKGLDDTVVRMPKITDDSPAPELPEPPKTQPRPATKVRPFDRDTKVNTPATAKTPASRPAVKAAPTVKEEATATISAPEKPEAPVKPVSPAFEPFAAPAFDSAPDSFLTTATTPAVPAAPVSAASASAAAAAPKAKSSSLRRTRKARLRLSRVDPWSVMKTSFLFSIAFGIMFWIATSVLWYVITSSGLFEAINAAIVNIISNPGNTETWRIEDYINGNKVLGIAALLAVINVVISTALGTLAAFLYNLSANILGGLELTLA